MIISYHLLKNCIKLCPALKGRQNFRKIEQNLIELKDRIAAVGVTLTSSVETTIEQVVPLPSYSAHDHHCLEALIITDMLKKREEVSVPPSAVEIVATPPTIHIDTAMADSIPIALTVSPELIRQEESDKEVDKTARQREATQFNCQLVFKENRTHSSISESEIKILI